MNLTPTTPLLAASAFLAGTSASAQVTATTLVETGDARVIRGQATTVESIDEFNVNPLGGYALLSGDGTQEFILGNIEALPPGVFATEGNLAGFTIDDFALAPDIANDGTVAFRAGTTNGSEVVVFRGGQAVAVRGNAVPASTGISADFNFPNRVQISADGAGTSFTSSLANAGGGAGALFTDDGANAPLRFFDNESGGNQSTSTNEGTLDAAIGNSSYEVSSSGDRYIAEVDLGALATNDNAVVVGEVGGTPAVPVIGGSPIREGSPVTSGSADVWDDFDRFGIADDGTYLFTGDLADGTEYLAVDGSIVLRTGDALGGGVVDGAFGTAEINNNGDYAAITTIADAGETRQTLLVNGESLLTVGDAVATAAGVETLASLETGVDHLGISDAVDGAFNVYFEGTTVEGTNGLFVLLVPEPTTAAVLGLGGLLLGRRRRA